MGAELFVVFSYYPLMSVMSLVSPFLLLILVICVLSFFPLSLLLAFYQFYGSFQRTYFWFYLKFTIICFITQDLVYVNNFALCT